VCFLCVIHPTSLHVNNTMRTYAQKNAKTSSSKQAIIMRDEKRRRERESELVLGQRTRKGPDGQECNEGGREEDRASGITYDDARRRRRREKIRERTVYMRCRNREKEGRLIAFPPTRAASDSIPSSNLTPDAQHANNSNNNDNHHNW